MKYAVDLHIHSALSPCAQDDMTPNNIVNMALLKGLDVISVTDHNTALNLSAIKECADEAGILLVPGIEIETSEEIHMVCYFPDIDKALYMQQNIYDCLPQVKNREDIFGHQYIMDKEDRIVSSEHRFLLTATALSVDDVIRLVGRLGGVALPAHVDRDSYSIIATFGVVPEYLDLKWIEVSRNADINKLMQKYPYLSSYRLICSSDAHRLGDIFEKHTFLNLAERNVSAIINKLRD